MATLYCPTCGYNLTGLPENRCPECGQEFDRARLADLVDQPRPVTPIGAVMRILGLPVSFWLTVLLFAATDNDSLLAFGFLIGFGQLSGGIFISGSLARRVAIGRAIRENRDLSDTHDYWFIVCWSAGLYLLQLALGAGGTICAFGIWMLSTYY